MALNKVGIWNQALSKIGHTSFIESETENTPARKVAEEFWDDCLKEVLESTRWPFALKQATLTDIKTQSVEYTGDASRTQFEFSFGYYAAGDVVVTIDGTVQTAATAYTLTAAADGVEAYVTMTSAPASGETLKITVTTENQGYLYTYTLPADYIAAVALVPLDVARSAIQQVNMVTYQVMSNPQGNGHLLFTNALASEFKLEYVHNYTHVRSMPGTFKSALAWRMAIELALALAKKPNLARMASQEYEVALSKAQAYALGRSGAQPGPGPMTPSLAARSQ